MAVYTEMELRKLRDTALPTDPTEVQSLLERITGRKWTRLGWSSGKNWTLVTSYITLVCLNGGKYHLTVGEEAGQVRSLFVVLQMLDEAGYLIKEVPKP